MSAGKGVKLIVFPSLCIGLRECKKWGPNVFILDENGCIDFERMEVDAAFADEARLGAELCPSNAILVIEE